MENNERDRKLDQWLDEALGEYSAAEPRFGLEQRVLHRVRADEQARSRKWNFWRWMPAVGAIAALVIVAVAIRPVIEKKAQVPVVEPAIVSNQTGPAKDAQAESQNHGLAVTSPTRPGKIRDVPPRALHVKPVQPVETSTESLAPTVVPEEDDRAKDAIKRELRVGVWDRYSPGSQLNALPPPPPPRTADGRSEEQPRIAAQKVEIPLTGRQVETESAATRDIIDLKVPSGIVGTEKVTSMAATMKEKKPNMAHSKPTDQPVDPDVTEVFGMRIRIQTGPTIPRQFPTPVPLSEQEKLMLTAAQKLKSSMVQQDKAGEIAPIEIKNVEIAPLEGPKR